MRNVEISPSVLSADLTKIEEELALARNSGAKYIHLDVMDGIFVPAVRLSFDWINKISKISKMVNDVHIMVEKPWETASKYITNGADILTFHYEACPDKSYIKKTIKIIKDLNCKVGMSIKPATDVKVLLPYLKELDLVLVMSVEPGKGGQSFMPSAIEKISSLRNYIDEHDLKTLIEVDGGINNETGKLVKEAGVDILVAGSYLFGHEDFKERANLLLNND